MESRTKTICGFTLSDTTKEKRGRERDLDWIITDKREEWGQHLGLRVQPPPEPLRKMRLKERRKIIAKKRRKEKTRT
jgi:hypothetical protein